MTTHLAVHTPPDSPPLDPQTGHRVVPLLATPPSVNSRPSSATALLATRHLDAHTFALYLRLQALSQNRRLQGPEKNGVSVRLTSAQYESLRYAIAADPVLSAWFINKARYDWTAPAGTQQTSHGTFFLRMPSPVHDNFAYHLCEAIKDGIKRVGVAATSEGNDVRVRLAASVKAQSTSDLKMASAGSKRSPDAGFGFRGMPNRMVVIEVAYSHKPPVREMACDYIKAGVKTVVGVDLEYRTPTQRSTGPPKIAVYSIFRRSRTLKTSMKKNGKPGWTIRTHAAVINQPFVTPNPVAVIATLHADVSEEEEPVEAMALRLSDFCPLSLTRPRIHPS